MPVTFFAHQVPVLPVARKWPGVSDGVALVIGSMAPDLAYVLNGSRFSIWAHEFPGLVTFCVPVTVCLAWIVVRVLAPVVPVHLPQLGNFRLQDYRGLATHRFGIVRTPVSAFVGALSHAGLDHLTHGWGWFARHVDWYDDVIIDGAWFGRPLTVFRILQYVGHVGGTAVCLWLLWRHGSQRWMSSRAELIPARRTASSTAWLWSAVAVGVVTAVVWTSVDSEGFATDLLRVSAGAFAGMVVGAMIARAGVPSGTSGTTATASAGQAPARNHRTRSRV